MHQDHQNRDSTVTEKDSQEMLYSSSNKVPKPINPSQYPYPPRFENPAPSCKCEKTISTGLHEESQKQFVADLLPCPRDVHPIKVKKETVK